ncbi:MAG: hypothetical protein RLZZ196_224 [Bacteroidota bacterium]|jgi:hypothetical protein
MKIKEIIVEDKAADVPPRLNQSTVGLDRFRDKEFADRIYELNRVMMAAAVSDGVSPLKINPESWAGRNNIAAPYTEIEQKILTQAFDAIGSHFTDLNKGNLKSEELPDTNTVSPIAKYKKNQFGV